MCDNLVSAIGNRLDEEKAGRIRTEIIAIMFRMPKATNKEREMIMQHRKKCWSSHRMKLFFIAAFVTTFLAMTAVSDTVQEYTI